MLWREHALYIEMVFTKNDLMKIALTGAAGHLGSAIIPELFKRVHQVRALVRDNNHSFTQLPVVFIKGDILNADSIRELLQDCDALIHCAAVISVNGDPGGVVHQTNVEGTKLVMDMAKQAGVKRVIHISSIHAYEQRPSFKVLDEQSEKVEKGFAYDHSKKAGQEIALSMNQPYVADRYIGGAITNFPQIKKRIEKLHELLSKKEKGELAVYTKKEQMLIQKDIERLDRNFGGLSNVTGLPGAIVVVDARKEDMCIKEAQRMRIPVVALANTDCNIDGIDYPIVCNEGAPSTVRVILEAIKKELA